MAPGYRAPNLPLQTENIFLNWSRYTKEIIIYLSLDGRILQFNPMAEKLFGKKRNDVLGDNFAELCALSEIQSPLPDDLAAILSDCPLVDVEITLADNRTVLNWSITRTLDTYEHPNGILLVAQNITELRELELSLKKAEEYAMGTNTELANFSQWVMGHDADSNKPAVEYAKNIYDYMETIVASMPGSVYWMNKQGIYLGCNDEMAELFNLKSRHDIEGKTYKDLYDPKSGDFYQAIDTEVMNSGIAKSLEEPLYNPDGTKSIYLSNKVPLRDVYGEVIGMLGISIDITERKKAEQALKEAKERAEAANLAKSDFLAVISHELRIPLTSILGMNQLLCSQNLPVSKQQEYLKHISTAGMHLLNLINDTLDFARLEAGQFELSSAPMDLKSLIEETSTMLTPLAKAKNLELLIHYDQNTPHQIYSDKRVLRQIIINLLGNAIKFTELGYVSIQVECIEQSAQTAKLVISVNDTGIGIPEDKQGIIFDHFSQVDASHSRRHGGAGLGLTITKQLVELMSGAVGVTSQIGRGTTFRCVIKFPLQKEAIADSPWMAYQSVVRILIVDDTLRGKVIQKQLSPSNSQVVSGKEAFETLLASYQLSDPYDIVIIDQKLSDIDPFELAKVLCQHQKPYPPMLALLTDDGSVNTKEIARVAGFYECIIKPIQPLALQVVLTAAWERWIEQREMKISLPLPTMDDPEQSNASVNRSKINPLKVLLVEDDAIVQIIHKNYLEQLVGTVEIANNGKEALALMNNDYDLIFMDMGLPDIHGTDVVKEFRERTLGKSHVPIVSLTGYGSASSQQEFLKSGVDQVIIKPVFIEQLEKVIKQYCG